MPNDLGTDYINTTDYKKHETKLKDLVTAMDELYDKNLINRRLRYQEIDIEGERARGTLQPDELLIPQHIIDSNVRREQSSYVQYVTQSNRAVVLTDLDDPAAITAPLETDVTSKLRFSGWQLSMFANIDGMQQNGYGVLEIVQDQNQAGELAHEFIQLGDFGFVADTKNIQDAELVARNYYFPKTRLLEMCDDEKWQFNREQVDKIIAQEPKSTDEMTITNKDKSLFKLQKVMFRIKGIVHVAWSCQNVADDWVRAPRPLYIGRRRIKQNPSVIELLKSKLSGLPVSEAAFETLYPYIIFPYLISENDVISQLKGRAYLDQDCQQAVTSLMSAYVTAHRRAAGLYFSKDVSDPNDDLMLQKNIFFKSGALINGKVTQFQLTPPTADVISSINLMISANQQETSQVNFAAQNRKDSRKTATEIQASNNAAQALSTVQVVLFSLALTSLYTTMYEVIKSRVLTGLIKVRPELIPLYQRRYSIKPAGDSDVIERLQLVQNMMMAWPVVKETPAAITFLCDLLSKMFPGTSAKYVQILQQAEAAQQSAQAQQQQAVLQKAKEMGQGIVSLSKKPEMFSDIGKIHALPAVEAGAEQIEQFEKETTK